MAVEKLSTPKFTKIRLRQEALQSISSGRLDIFYPPNSASFRGKGSFSTPTGVSTHPIKEDVKKKIFSVRCFLFPLSKMFHSYAYRRKILCHYCLANLDQERIP